MLNLMPGWTSECQRALNYGKRQVTVGNKPLIMGGEE